MDVIYFKILLKTLLWSQNIKHNYMAVHIEESRCFLELSLKNLIDWIDVKLLGCTFRIDHQEISTQLNKAEKSRFSQKAFKRHLIYHGGGYSTRYQGQLIERCRRCQSPDKCRSHHLRKWTKNQNQWSTHTLESCCSRKPTSTAKPENVQAIIWGDENYFQRV